jgi:hypothetical protein
MASRVSFSYQELSLEAVAVYHADVQAGLFDFFAGKSKTLLDRYADELIDDARGKAFAELDLSSSFSVLSSVEAAIRLDYLSRAYGRWRDPLSKAMKALHDEKENRASVTDHLISLWRDHTTVSRALLSEVIGAFNYRHWLAHGRYWTPKLGRRYDYETIYEIAQEFVDAIDAYSNANKKVHVGRA